MIAVTFALPDESGVFLKSIRDLRTVSGGSLPVYFGTLDGLEIAVLHTGVGETSARPRLTRFLSDHRPMLLISSGFAGALDPSLPIGALVVAENFSSPAPLESARLFFHASRSVFFGGLTTQSLPSESVSSKHALSVETGALAVDMETTALASLCSAASIPFLSVRAVSDTALQPLPLPFSVWFDSVEQKARVSSLLLYLATHPAVIPDFYRFVRGVFRAKKMLAAELRKLIVLLGTCEGSPGGLV
jgi:adenosylhomocysteine nucleosidase